MTTKDQVVQLQRRASRFSKPMRRNKGSTLVPFYNLLSFFNESTLRRNFVSGARRKKSSHSAEIRVIHRSSPTPRRAKSHRGGAWGAGRQDRVEPADERDAGGDGAGAVPELVRGFRPRPRQTRRPPTRRPRRSHRRPLPRHLPRLRNRSHSERLDYKPAGSATRGGNPDAEPKMGGGSTRTTPRIPPQRLPPTPTASHRPTRNSGRFPRSALPPHRQSPAAAWGNRVERQQRAQTLANWARQRPRQSRATGTTFAEISKQNFRPIPVVLPPTELMALSPPKSRRSTPKSPRTSTNPAPSPPCATRCCRSC